MEAEKTMVPGLVSVVTASYNMGGYIAETLESVLGQDYPHVESIVVDDGSSDDTQQVLERFGSDPRVRIVRQANSGQTIAKNRGVAEARGEFIAFCDADDVWEPHKLSRQIPCFHGAPDIGVVFSEVTWMDESGRRIPSIHMKRFQGWVTAPLMIDNFVPFPTVVARAAVIREFGGFDERLSMSIDYDLWLRISTRYRFAFVDEALARYRIWPGQMSHKVGERLENFFRLLERFLKDNPDIATKRQIDQAYAHVHVTRGYWHAREGRRAEAWRDYREALRRDPLALRMWKRIVSLGLDRDRIRPGAHEAARRDGRRGLRARLGPLRSQLPPARAEPLAPQPMGRAGNCRRAPAGEAARDHPPRRRDLCLLPRPLGCGRHRCRDRSHRGGPPPAADPHQGRHPPAPGRTRLQSLPQAGSASREDRWLDRRLAGGLLRRARHPEARRRRAPFRRVVGWRLGQPMAAAWGNPPAPRTWKARLRARLRTASSTWTRCVSTSPRSCASWPSGTACGRACCSGTRIRCSSWRSICLRTDARCGRRASWRPA
ncbi:MAG: glycosyltransferase [Betaproteobacteria bacterium]|nr:glycosyltransferase [Betaproteobacteria bacterium]